MKLHLNLHLYPWQHDSKEIMHQIPSNGRPLSCFYDKYKVLVEKVCHKGVEVCHLMLPKKHSLISLMCVIP